MIGTKLTFRGSIVWSPVKNTKYKLWLHWMNLNVTIFLLNETKQLNVNGIIKKENSLGFSKILFLFELTSDMNDGFLPRGRQLDFIHQRVLQKINVRSFPRLPQTRLNVQLNVLSKWAKPADGPSRPNRAIKQSINPLFLHLGARHLYIFTSPFHSFVRTFLGSSQTFWIKQCIGKYGVRQAWVLPAHLATVRAEVRCYGQNPHLAKHQRVLSKLIRISSILWTLYLIEMRILCIRFCRKHSDLDCVHNTLRYFNLTPRACL